MTLASALLGGLPPGAAIALTVADSLAGYLRPLCLTPEAGRTLQNLMDTGTLRKPLADGSSISGGAIRPHSIEISVRDTGGHSHRLALALPGSSLSGPRIGAGNRFTFHLAADSDAPSAAATDSLLELAKIIDEAIPETALVRCANEAAPRTDRRFPVAWILVGAILQLCVLVAATSYGLNAIRAGTQ